MKKSQKSGVSKKIKITVEISADILLQAMRHTHSFTTIDSLFEMAVVKHILRTGSDQELLNKISKKKDKS